jgi:hypothetical protein
MIKINTHKIEIQPKNIHLFEIVIPIKSKQKSIIDSIS